MADYLGGFNYGGDFSGASDFGNLGDLGSSLGGDIGNPSGGGFNWSQLGQDILPGAILGGASAITNAIHNPATDVANIQTGSNEAIERMRLDRSQRQHALMDKFGGILSKILDMGTPHIGQPPVQFQHGGVPNYTPPPQGYDQGGDLNQQKQNLMNQLSALSAHINGVPGPGGR